MPNTFTSGVDNSALRQHSKHPAEPAASSRPGVLSERGSARGGAREGAARAASSGAQQVLPRLGERVALAGTVPSTSGPIARPYLQHYSSAGVLAGSARLHTGNVIASEREQLCACGFLLHLMPSRPADTSVPRTSVRSRSVSLKKPYEYTRVVSLSEGYQSSYHSQRDKRARKGKRRGSLAVYIEPHHADILDFLELRRGHDICCAVFLQELL